ncbi:hypothetical protein [Nocardiopsis aegyptia]|uniref:Uncharacterized protein n=1 Tax=Nocardiopsis aegyptia TaxID=220378 RepID=A0A7Z0EQ88_9ACTN|nr:hypothetical protein [Nocardiopsis aegyptia]NYJ35290.1 hypothetical protein [Nocardiopsis aegyptia]
MRYLNPSALVAVRYLAEERLRRRRPRRAARARAYAPWPIPRPRVPLDAAPTAILATVLDGLRRLEASPR